MKYITKAYNNKKEIVSFRVVFPKDKTSKYAKRFPIKDNDIPKAFNKAKEYFKSIEQDLIEDSIIHVNSCFAKRRFHALPNKLKHLPLNIFYNKTTNVYCTIYRANKLTYTKSFSVNKYGEAEALMLAINALKEIKSSVGEKN